MQGVLGNNFMISKKFRREVHHLLLVPRGAFWLEETYPFVGYHSGSFLEQLYDFNKFPKVRGTLLGTSTS